MSTKRISLKHSEQIEVPTSHLPPQLAKKLAALGGLPVKPQPVERLKTGSLRLDNILGGGLPRGHITTISGDSDTGKTTLSLSISSFVTQNPENMKKSGRVAWFDLENKFPADWSARLGVDADLFDFYQPVTGEQALDMLCLMVEADYYDLIVYDSVASTLFAAEAEASMENMHVGLAARRWGQAIRKMKTALIGKSTAVLLINQLRHNIGEMYGPKFFEPGGKALKYQPTVKITMLSPNKKDPGALILRPKISKQHTADTDGRETEVRLITNVPSPFVDIVPELTDLGREMFIFVKEDGSPISGSCNWYHKGNLIGKGEDAVRAALYANEELREFVTASVYDAIAHNTAAPLLYQESEPTDGDD